MKKKIWAIMCKDYSEPERKRSPRVFFTSRREAEINKEYPGEYVVPGMFVYKPKKKP